MSEAQFRRVFLMVSPKVAVVPISSQVRAQPVGVLFSRAQVLSRSRASAGRVSQRELDPAVLHFVAPWVTVYRILPVLPVLLGRVGGPAVSEVLSGGVLQAERP